MSTEQGYSWDQPTIEKPKEDGEFTLLEPGEYPFTVLKFERSRHEGSAKLPPCNKAIIYINVDGGALGTTVIKNNLFLHPKCEGLICQFAAAIGQRKHGDPLDIPGLFSDMAGRAGTVKLKHREHDGKTYNEIDRFLDPPGYNNGAAPAQAQLPAMAQAGTQAAAADEEEEIPF